MLIILCWVIASVGIFREQLTSLLCFSFFFLEAVFGRICYYSNPCKVGPSAVFSDGYCLFAVVIKTACISACTSTAFICITSKKTLKWHSISNVIITEVCRTLTSRVSFSLANLWTFLWKVKPENVSQNLHHKFFSCGYAVIGLGVDDTSP